MNGRRNKTWESNLIVNPTINENDDKLWRISSQSTHITFRPHVLRIFILLTTISVSFSICRETGVIFANGKVSNLQTKVNLFLRQLPVQSAIVLNNRWTSLHFIDTFIIRHSLHIKYPLTFHILQYHISSAKMISQRIIKQIKYLDRVGTLFGERLLS